jgi:hypothetical protein
MERVRSLALSGRAYNGHEPTRLTQSRECEDARGPGSGSGLGVATARCSRTGRALPRLRIRGTSRAVPFLVVSSAPSRTYGSLSKINWAAATCKVRTCCPMRAITMGRSDAPPAVRAIALRSASSALPSSCDDAGPVPFSSALPRRSSSSVRWSTKRFPSEPVRRSWWLIYGAYRRWSARRRYPSLRISRIIATRDPLTDQGGPH